MKSDGTTGVTPKNEKTNDFMKKMLSAITKTSQKPKVPAVSPFQKKKPSILVNGDGMTHKVMSVTQIKTDIKKVLEKNDHQKDHKKDLKLSEKEKGKENQKQNEKEETKPNVKETTSREDSEKVTVQDKKEPEVTPMVTTVPPAVTELVTKSSTIQKDNKENGNKIEPTPSASSSITHSSTVPLTTPVPPSDLSKEKAVIPTTTPKAPVTSTSATPLTSVPSSSIATTSATSKTVTSTAATSKPTAKTIANQPQPKKQTPIEKVKQLLSARAKVKKQPITEPIKPKTLIGSSEIEHVLKAVKLPETNSETNSDSQPVPSSSSNQNQLLSTQKETTIKNEETPKSDDNSTLKTRNTSSSSLEPCLLDPIPQKETKEPPSKEVKPPVTLSEPSSKETMPSTVIAPVVNQKAAAEVTKPSPSLTENKLEQTKMVPDISSTIKQDSNPDNKTVETSSSSTDSQSNPSILVPAEKITNEKSDSQPSKVASALEATQSADSKEASKEPEIPPTATTPAKSIEDPKVPPGGTEAATKSVVPDPVVTPVDLPAQPLSKSSTSTMSDTPSSSAIEQKKTEIMNKPPNKAIVNLISSEMAPGSPGADSEDDLPLDVIVIKKSSKEPEPKKEPTPAPPVAPTTESILTVNPVEAPIGQPTPSMNMFDQPTGTAVPPIVSEASQPDTPTANPLDLVFGPEDDNIFGNTPDDPSALLPDIFGPTSTPPLPTVTSHSLPGTVPLSVGASVPIFFSMIFIKSENISYWINRTSKSVTVTNFWYGRISSPPINACYANTTTTWCRFFTNIARNTVCCST